MGRIKIANLPPKVVYNILLFIFQGGGTDIDMCRGYSYARTLTVKHNCPHSKNSPVPSSTRTPIISWSNNVSVSTKLPPYRSEVLHLTAVGMRRGYVSR
jgi:hypothetical protein